MPLELYRLLNPICVYMQIIFVISVIITIWRVPRAADAARGRHGLNKPGSGRALSFVKTGSPAITVGHPLAAAVAECSARCTASAKCLCFRLTASTGQCDLSPPLKNPNAAATAMTWPMTMNGSNSSTPFHFYTWDVYGTVSNKTNLAFEKHSVQSSEHTFKNLRYSAERAINHIRRLSSSLSSAPSVSGGGGGGGARGRGSVSSRRLAAFSSTSRAANRRDVFPWWQVDLRREFVITRLQFYYPSGEALADNHTDPLPPLHDLEVRVGNGPVTSAFNRKAININSLCAFRRGFVAPGGGSPSTLITITCRPCLVTGRFVSLQITRFCDPELQNQDHNGGSGDGSQSCAAETANVLALSGLRIFGFDPVE